MSEDNNKKSETAKREEEVLKFWQESDIFKKTLDKEAPEGEFVFYDGPPFATGLPHYGSLLSSIVKDAIPRYKTMRGFNVRRRWGWDCHGLPIENMIEKRLDIKDKKEITEEIGIEKFNKSCRESVLEYADEWKKYIDRVGRFVEYEDSYKTMDNSYIESVWWALSNLYNKDLLYEGRKVLMYCPRCETPIAKAEVAMDNSYEDVTEEAVTIEFRLKDRENTSLLAWTTTPWTLPGNVALAVNPEIIYVEIEKKDMGVGELVRFILAKDRLENIFNEEDYKIVKEIKGEDLIGLEYEPLFEIPAVKDSDKKAHYVAEADFVTTEEGTGIVHIASMYGEDDYNLGVEKDLPMIPLLDEKGHFNEEAPEFIRGQYFKKAEKAIKADLKDRGLLFLVKNNTHSYPHCHRCGTALIYNAITSWFLKIQAVKERMIKLNQDINWVPNYLKDGRFLNIVANAPDWTISRNRFWASPLPIWKGDKGSLEVLGSLEELKAKTKSSNKYTLLRHGQSTKKDLGVISSSLDNKYPLTDKGKEQVKEVAKEIKEKNIDVIIYSPIGRTKETAEILAREIDFKGEMIENKEIREMEFGKLDGKHFSEYHKYLDEARDFYTTPLPEGESFLDVKMRIGKAIKELENKYQDKNILLIGHGVMFEVLPAVALGANLSQSKEIKAEGHNYGNCATLELDYYNLPRNEYFELDLHRPYIDEVTWTNEKGEKMTRVPEVVDGWVESASMPFAEYHYPFENKDSFEKRFPGDFVSEYIAQTRTWFYYMHAMATMLFDDKAFKNVLSTGTILAEDGSKMSKSKGNYTDPLSNLDKFGADALRYYLLTSVVMQSEDLRFSDREVGDVHNRLINILWNVVKFYKMYASDKAGGDPYLSSNPLDKWILSRLGQLQNVVTTNLDQFETVKAGRPIKDFVTDLSTWYIRRSRDRFKDLDTEDGKNAILVTRYVLIELSKIIAPFMPFMAESIYKEINADASSEMSVHLEDWPKEKEVDDEILVEMDKVRQLVSLVLEKRATAGLKVRQPIGEIYLKEEVQDKYKSIILDEVNAKEIVIKKDLKEEVDINTKISPELKKEGEMRDVIRQIQSLRKELSLTPDQKVSLIIETNDEGRDVIESFKEEIKESVGALDIDFKDNVEGKECQIGDIEFIFEILK